jgi:hypothetical protein
MNSFSPNYLLFVFSCFIYVSCTKTTNSISANTGTNIYVAGNNGTNPVLWKNGTANMLSSSVGSANQVIVSGNDVYVAGISPESQNLDPGGPSGQYVYWKNGIQNNIGGFEFVEFPSSISVGGNNVYYSNSNCWINGARITLQGQGSGYVQSTFAVGTDIYFAGSDSVGDAVYWKNGKLNVVAQGYYPTYSSGSDPSAFCIYTSGNDVYVGGSSIDNTAVYWKNGIATTLKSAISGSYVTSVISIFVSGNDVYASANLIVPTHGGVNAPAYWKNGVVYDLPLNGATNGNTSSIFVSGSDVYVAGWTSSAGAVYWKNGVETILSSSGQANSIYIQ